MGCRSKLLVGVRGMTVVISDVLNLGYIGLFARCFQV